MIKRFIWLLYCVPSIALAAPVLDLHNWKTTAGTPVYFVASKSVPMVDIALVFNAGSAYDGEEAGVATATNSLFGERTQQWDATEIAERFSRVGANFSNNASRSIAILSLRSLTEPEKLSSALNTFTEVIANVDFARHDLALIKQQMASALKGQQQDAEALASARLMASLFGNSAYGHDPLGTLDSIDSISISDIKDFYQTYYVAQNAFIVIVGDVSQTEAQDIAEEITSRLPTGKSAQSITFAPSSNSSVLHIDFPSTQNHIRMGEISIGHNDPDYFALAVGNYILGNGFTSRLFQQVREQRGLSYYVGSSLVPLPNNSLFMIMLQTKNSTRDEAINITTNTLKKFIQEGPTNAELENAKRSIIGAFPLTFDSNSAILSAVVSLAFLHLPLNYFDTYPEKINAVTATQVKATLQKNIALNKLTVVSVGG